MNKSQARKILGLDGSENEREVKKKYRKLMHDHHPDSSGSADGQMAAKINTAYELIMKGFESGAVVARGLKNRAGDYISSRFKKKGG